MLQESGRVLTQFRAGRAEYKNGVVTPQAAKGTLSVSETRNAAKVLLTWSGAEPPVNILLPKSGVTVKFVEKCTTGRVLLFEESPTERHFFWLQEKSTVDDQECLKKLKEIFTGPVAATNQNTPQVGLNDFKKLLASISSGGKSKVGIADVLSSAKLSQAVKADEEFYKSRLSALLPPGSNANDIVGQLQNAQVQTTAVNLDAALSEPATYKELCKTFEIPEEEGQLGAEAFLSALQKSAKKE